MVLSGKEICYEFAKQKLQMVSEGVIQSLQSTIYLFQYINGYTEFELPIDVLVELVRHSLHPADDQCDCSCQ